MRHPRSSIGWNPTLTFFQTQFLLPASILKHEERGLNVFEILRTPFVFLSRTPFEFQVLGCLALIEVFGYNRWLHPSREVYHKNLLLACGPTSGIHGIVEM